MLLITADEAIDNVMLEDALKTGDIAAGLLKGIDNASEYEAERIAVEAKAKLKIGKSVLYNVEKVDEYLEHFYVEE